MARTCTKQLGREPGWKDSVSARLDLTGADSARTISGVLREGDKSLSPRGVLDPGGSFFSGPTSTSPRAGSQDAGSSLRPPFRRSLGLGIDPTDPGLQQDEPALVDDQLALQDGAALMHAQLA